MNLIQVPGCAAILLTVIPFRELKAQAQQPSSGAPKIQVTSALVFLDVTVLDKKGRPVVSGLTQDDFTLTEDKQPQRIFSSKRRRRMSWDRMPRIATRKERHQSPYWCSIC